MIRDIINVLKTLIECITSNPIVSLFVLIPIVGSYVKYKNRKKV